MIKKYNYFLFLFLVVFSYSNVTHANELNAKDLQFAFASSTTTSSDSFGVLSELDMMETEGEWWPVVYGVAWGAARVSIYAAGRYGSRWGYRAVTSSNNHRILLRNNQHVLQTGGSRTSTGFGQNASHIGWGRSTRGNFSNTHLFRNSPWRFR